MGRPRLSSEEISSRGAIAEALLYIIVEALPLPPKDAKHKKVRERRQRVLDGLQNLAALGKQRASEIVTSDDSSPTKTGESSNTSNVPPAPRTDICVEFTAPERDEPVRPGTVAGTPFNPSQFQHVEDR